MNLISYKTDGAYALITLHNEGKFNPDLLREFNLALDEALQKNHIQAVILTGEDKNFSQGLDLASMSTMDGLSASTFVNACMEAVGRLLTFPIPVVSAVNGHAFGLGAMLSLASDYAVMRDDKGFFCLPEIDIKMNLIPSMNALVTHKLHGKVLRDVLLTGKRIGGVEAANLHIVDCCASEHELLNVAKTLPLNMMGKDRTVLAQLKRGINAAILTEHFNKA